MHKFPYRWTLKDARFTKDKGKVFSYSACGGGSTMGYKLAGFDVIGCKPNNEVLRKDGIVHTRTKQFCSDECYANWNHDRQAKQYCNLRQHGRIHNNE